MTIWNILWFAYWTFGGGYGIYLQDQFIKNGGDKLSTWEQMRWQLIVMFLWPGLLVARTVKNRKEIRHKQAILMKKRGEQEAQETRNAIVKAKADAAEEAWAYIRADNEKKHREKLTRNQAEHREWDNLEKQALEAAYRNLNYSGIREARLRARSEGRDGEANMLSRILDDKTLEAVSHPGVLHSMTPDERQLVQIRQQEIYEERQRKWGYTGHHAWVPDGCYIDDQGNYRRR